MKVWLSPVAGRQIAEFVDWWDAHRRDARVRVEDAFEAAISALAEHPEAGPACSRDSRCRTWRLKGTP